MKQNRIHRLALSAGLLALALSATPPVAADVYQDRFCRLSKNLDVPGRSALSGEVTKFPGAFEAMKSFFIALAAVDQQRHLARDLYTKATKLADFLDKNLNTKTEPRSWASLNFAAQFRSAIRKVEKNALAALAVTEDKAAAVLKKAASVSRWEAVMSSQKHSADTSALTATEENALNDSALPSSYAKLFRPLLFVQYGLQTWPAMLSELRTATSAICTKAKGMKAGAFVKTAAEEYADYLTKTGEDMTALEAFLRKWGPELQTASATIKGLEAGLPAVKTALDAVVAALAPIDELQEVVDASMAETLCMKGHDTCLKLGEYPVKSKAWLPAPGTKADRNWTPPAPYTARMVFELAARVHRRISALFDPATKTIPQTLPALSALDSAADKMGGAITTLNSFFTALELVIDISMDGEADALQAIIVELNNQKLE
jgi:hypothetical protein